MKTIDISESNFPEFNKAIMVSYAGSRVYGTEMSESDLDVVAVVIPGLEYYFGLRQYESKQIKIDGCDVTVHEFKKFVSLCRKGNPNCLELLWMPEKFLIRDTQFAKELRANRELFSGKHIFKHFLGYARSQFHKMTVGENENCGDKRRQEIAKFGYDVKNASHLIRILLMGLQFLRTGQLIVGYASDEVFDVKRGRWSLQYIKDWADILFFEIEMTLKNADLSEGPQHEKIDRMCCHILSQWFLAKVERITND